MSSHSESEKSNKSESLSELESLNSSKSSNDSNSSDKSSSANDSNGSAKSSEDTPDLNIARYEPLPGDAPRESPIDSYAWVNNLKDGPPGYFDLNERVRNALYPFAGKRKTLTQKSAFVRPENFKSTAQLNKLRKTLKGEKLSILDPMCVRNVSNWSSLNKTHKIDKPEFNPDEVMVALDKYSPKLKKIMENIEKFDREDMQKYGRKFKHFIFSDLKNGNGPKIIAAALVAHGFHSAYKVGQSRDGTPKLLGLKSEQQLQENPGQNFILMTSTSLYGEPLRVGFKKQAFALFNSRPENTYGKLARIIVMDSGFKEGIDLFDIKYVHIFEPSTTHADQKQVIGRGTRTCGQKGLKFNPRSGWPLYVYKYDLRFSSDYLKDFQKAETAFAYYLLGAKIDIRLLTLASNIEDVSIRGAVDYQLNRNIHEFSADSSESLLSRGGAPNQVADDELVAKLSANHRPGQKHRVFQDYVDSNFSEFSWDKVQMENLCGYAGPESMVTPRLQRGGAPTLINLSPTQGFISTYFKPSLPLKGMLLWQSVGTGKTCTAIATATRQFEPAGYTILWVTRTTLKNDIWKNMFDMVCHEGIRDKIASGVTVPNTQTERMRLLSKSWSVRPMSYKQFSNLVSKNNQIYHTLVKKNGAVDPLRKTLIIIDEAHKLYGGGDLSSIERPDMDAFHRALMNSYEISGENSVRIMLMTATPITTSPMELVKLINLCKPIDQQIPAEFEQFADQFLDDTGNFTAIGHNQFMDNIAGHISYLNREGDVRQFARPILKNVDVPLVNAELQRDVNRFDVPGLNADRRAIVEQQMKIQDAVDSYKEKKEFLTKENVNRITRECDQYEGKYKKKCDTFARQTVAAFMREGKAKFKIINEAIKDSRHDLRNLKAATPSLERIKIVRENRTELPEEYKEYTKTIYPRLKKCESTIAKKDELNALIEEDPFYLKSQDAMALMDSEIAHAKQILSTEEHIMENKIKSYNNLLKSSELTKDERSVIKSTIKTARKRLAKTRKDNLKGMRALVNLKHDNERYIKNIKMARKKNTMKEIRMHMKTQRSLNRTADKVELEEDKLPAEFREDLQNAREELNNSVKEIIDEDARKLAAKAAEKERKAQEKAAEKDRKAQEKEAEKERKAQEKEAEKERKAQEKEAEKQRKAQEKAAEQTRKAQEREAKKLTQKKR